MFPLEVVPIQFCIFQNIKLEGVYPPVGPQSGGTRLAITGQYLNIGTSITATLDELPCYINSTQASSTRLTCITSRYARKTHVLFADISKPTPCDINLTNVVYRANYPRAIKKLTLFIDGANRTFEGNPFNYTQDPTIMEIKPLKSFASGGRMITVHGTNLDTILKPEMVVYVADEPNPINKSVG